MKLKPKIITDSAIYEGNEITFFRDLQCLGIDREGAYFYNHIDNIFNLEDLRSTNGNFTNLMSSINESAELRIWLLYYLDLDLDESGFLI